MPLDSGSLKYEPVSSLLIQTIISAFTFLTALYIRDSTTEAVALVTPGQKQKKFVFTLFFTMLFLFLTVLMAWTYQDHIKP